MGHTPFLSKSNETRFAGLSFEKAAACCSALRRNGLHIPRIGVSANARPFHRFSFQSSIRSAGLSTGDNLLARLQAEMNFFRDTCSRKK
jgi:hypothetical protein